jgi:hypothetical protein
MKKKIVIGSLLGLILALAMAAPAMAHHPAATHHHHIVLPNGKCVTPPATHGSFGNADDQNGNAAVVFHHDYQHGGTVCSEH